MAKVIAEDRLFLSENALASLRKFAAEESIPDCGEKDKKRPLFERVIHLVLFTIPCYNFSLLTNYHGGISFGKKNPCYSR